MADVNVKANVKRTSTLGKVRILVEQVVGSPSQAQINAAVASYIDSHPGSLSPLSQATKSALLDIAEHVAYIDANGQSYYNALDAALNAKALLSITAVYTQSGTVYDTDSLDSLKSDLVVTAHYDDGTTTDVTSACTLSGTLAEGTSAITVTYQEKTATFDVVVSAAEGYVTDGLIAYWDAIDNTGAAHDASATSWTDKVAGYLFNFNNTTGHVWNADNLQLSSGHAGLLTPQRYWSTNANSTIEIVLAADSVRSQVACMFDPNSSDSTMPSGTDAREFVLYSDNTVGFKAASGKTYSLPSGVSDITGVKKMVAIYSNYTVSSAYVNNTAVSLGANTHSYGIWGTNNFRLGEWMNNASGSNSAPFYGKIYAVRVYNRALTAEEITQNYNYDMTRFNLDSEPEPAETIEIEGNNKALNESAAVGTSFDGCKITNNNRFRTVNPVAVKRGDVINFSISNANDTLGIYYLWFDENQNYTGVHTSAWDYTGEFTVNQDYPYIGFGMRTKTNQSNIAYSGAVLTVTITRS